MEFWIYLLAFCDYLCVTEKWVFSLRERYPAMQLLVAMLMYVGTFSGSCGRV